MTERSGLAHAATARAAAAAAAAARRRRRANASPRRRYVARVHHWGTASERFLWFAMDFCGGGDLRARVVPGEGVRDRAWTVRAMRELLEGLSAMHARDITHLDLKVRVRLLLLLLPLLLLLIII